MTSSIPKHDLYEAPNERAISVNGWRISTTTNPISNSNECDALQAALGIPLPEMTFGNNKLTLTHQPTGWVYVFDAPGSLSEVSTEGDGGIKVGHAKSWLDSRCGQQNLL